MFSVFKCNLLFYLQGCVSAEDCGKGRYCHVDMHRSTCLQCKALDVVSRLISTVNWSPCAIKFYLTTKYFETGASQCCQWHIREGRFDRWQWVCLFSLFQWGFSLGFPASSHSPETCMWGKLENQNCAVGLSMSASDYLSHCVALQ